MSQLDELVRAMQILGGMAEEHLQGQHDQSTHGQRDGGSATEPKPTKIRLSIDDISAEHQKIKSKIGEEAYNDLLGTTNWWLASSGSSHAIMLEHIASEKYGGEIHVTYGVLSREEGEDATRDSGMDRTQAEKVFDAQYEHTQNVLKTQYPDGYIEIYRGTWNRKGAIPESGNVSVSMDALSSWTTDLNTARVFATGNKQGRVIKIRVPIENVWASYETNPKIRERREDEVIVMGRGKTAEAEVVP